MKRKKDIRHSFWKHKHKFLERDIPGKGVKTCVGEAFLQDEIALKIRFVRNNKKNKKNLKKVLTKGEWFGILTKLSLRQALRQRHWQRKS